MISADLHFRGFSKPTIHPQRKQPEQFDYQTVSYTSMWNPTSGNYTRYGAVDRLLAQPDDRMVVMGSGDEVRLLFNAAALPTVPAGWQRDFLLLVDGWAKDADANTAFSQTVLPLPFHAMSSYPYPPNEHFPDAALHDLTPYLTRPALRLLRPLIPTASQTPLASARGSEPSRDRKGAIARYPLAAAMFLAKAGNTLNHRPALRLLCPRIPTASQTSVAHALVRAASPLMPTLGSATPRAPGQWGRPPGLRGSPWTRSPEAN